MKNNKIIWGGKNKTTQLKMIDFDWLDDEERQSEVPTGTTEVQVPANAVDLKVFKIISTISGNTSLELVYSDSVDPSTGQYILSANDVVELGNGNFRLSIDGIMSNDFSIAIAPAVQQLPPETIKAAHYKLVPSPQIVETLVTQIVASDNGKVDVPVQFGVDYSVFNLAPPGAINAGEQVIEGGFSIPDPTPTPDIDDTPRLEPDNFSFPVTEFSIGNRPNYIESGVRSITGINQQVDVRVRQPQHLDVHFKINDGGWGDKRRPVNPGDTIQVRVKAKNYSFFKTPLALQELMGGVTIIVDIGQGSYQWRLEEQVFSYTDQTSSGGGGDDFDYGGS